MYKTPILLIIFNRPDTTQQVFDVIKQVRPEKLYVASDGARKDKPDDIEAIKKAREVLSQIDWNCEVSTLFQTKNLGCRLGPQTAINWFFEQEEMGVILEDDALPDLSFFPFCEELLIKYKENKRILNIVGGNLGYKHKGEESYLFARLLNTVGWATWRDRIQNIDFAMEDWKSSKHKKLKAIKLLQYNIFDWNIKFFKKWYYIWNKSINEELNVTWWDYQFIYNQLLNKRLTIVPAKNLIKNIGYNTQGTHTLNEQNPIAKLETSKISFPLKHPSSIKPNYTFEMEYIRKKWFSQ